MTEMASIGALGYVMWGLATIGSTLGIYRAGVAVQGVWAQQARSPDGKLSMELDKVVRCPVGRCAYIRVEVDLTMTSNRARNDMQMKGFVLRDFESGVDLESELEGTLSLSEYVVENGKGGRLRVAGEATLRHRKK